MGLIKVAINAIGGTLHDQWEDYIKCDSLSNDVLVVKKTTDTGVITNKSTIIVDYAHTPDAVEKIINTVKNVSCGKIYVVFGCTGDRDRTKRPIMTEIVLSNSHMGIITIDDLHNEDPDRIVSDMLSENKRNNYRIYLDRKEAIEYGINKLEDNDFLLILGKGHEEAIIVKDKRIPFNDHNVVMDIIKEKVEMI